MTAKTDLKPPLSYALERKNQGRIHYLLECKRKETSQQPLWIIEWMLHNSMSMKICSSLGKIIYNSGSMYTDLIFLPFLMNSF